MLHPFPFYPPLNTNFLLVTRLLVSPTPTHTHLNPFLSWPASKDYRYWVKGWGGGTAPYPSPIIRPRVLHLFPPFPPPPSILPNNREAPGRQVFQVIACYLCWSHQAGHLIPALHNGPHCPQITRLTDPGVPFHINLPERITVFIHINFHLIVLIQGEKRIFSFDQKDPLSTMRKMQFSLLQLALIISN